MRRWTLVVAVPLVAVLAFVAGAYFSVKKHPTTAACCGQKHETTRPHELVKRAQIPHRPRPQLPDIARTPPVDIRKALAALDPQYVAALGTWSKVPPGTALSELLWVRLPEFTRDEKGLIYEMKITKSEGMTDPTVQEIIRGESPITEPRHTLNAIDALMELALSHEHGVARLLEFITEKHDTTYAIAPDLLAAARARASLALRGQTLDESELQQLRNMLAQEADPITRAAAYAVFASHDRAEDLSRWLATERDERAVHALLVEFTRWDTSQDDGASTIRQARYGAKCAALLYAVLQEQQFPTRLKSLALAGLGLRVQEPGVVDFVLARVVAEREEDLKQGCIEALGNAITNVHAEKAVEVVLHSRTESRAVRQAAAIAMGNFSTSTAAESLARLVLKRDHDLALVAAGALGSNFTSLSPETRDALRQHLASEASPAVRAVLTELLRP